MAALPYCVCAARNSVLSHVIRPTKIVIPPALSGAEGTGGTALSAVPERR